MFALAAASATGYSLMHERTASANDEADPPITAPPPAVTPESAPASEHAAPAEPAPDFTMADRQAKSPDVPDNPTKDMVLLGTPGVEGGLEPEQVERTVKGSVARYERCMRVAKQHGQLERGDLRVQFVIGPTGKVLEAEGRTTVDPKLAQCVVQAIEKLAFAKPSDKGKVKVVYPIEFVPAGSHEEPQATPPEPQATPPKPHASPDMPQNP